MIIAWNEHRETLWEHIIKVDSSNQLKAEQQLYRSSHSTVALIDGLWEEHPRRKTASQDTSPLQLFLSTSTT